MNGRQLFTEVEEHFRPVLQRLGFVEASRTFDEKNFWNSLIRFNSPSLSITFVRDREDRLIYVAEPSSRESFHIDLVLRFLGIQPADERYKNAALLANELDAHFEAIADAVTKRSDALILFRETESEQRWLHAGEKQ